MARQTPTVRLYLTTERLWLRWFTPDDVALLVALDSDPGVKRYIDGDGPVDLADITEMLDWWLGYEQRLPGSGFGFWAAIERDSGDFLGWFHLRPGDGAGPLEPELGYRLHRSAWGRGLGTEGARALVDRAFGALGAERVYATAMAVNHGSRRVMEKSGLRLVRSFHADWPVRIPGDEDGDVEYVITRAEWDADCAGA